MNINFLDVEPLFNLAVLLGFTVLSYYLSKAIIDYIMVF